MLSAHLILTDLQEKTVASAVNSFPSTWSLCRDSQSHHAHSRSRDHPHSNADLHQDHMTQAPQAAKQGRCEHFRQHQVLLIPVLRHYLLNTIIGGASSTESSDEDMPVLSLYTELKDDPAQITDGLVGTIAQHIYSRPVVRLLSVKEERNAKGICYGTLPRKECLPTLKRIYKVSAAVFQAHNWRSRFLIGSGERHDIHDGYDGLVLFAQSSSSCDVAYPSKLYLLTIISFRDLRFLSYAFKHVVL